MSEDVRPGAPALPAVDDSGTGRRPQLAILFVAVTMTRLLFAIDRVVFTVPFDEPAQLAIGRSLAGRTPWNMYDVPTWQPGLGTLLVPVFLVTDNSEIVYRVALSINAVVGGASAVLLVLVARRLTDVSLRGCVILAAVVSVLPAGMSASAHSWGDPLVTLTFLGTLLLLLRYVRDDRTGVAIAAGATSIAGFVAHGRMGPMVAVATITVAWSLIRNGRVGPAVAWVGAMAAATASAFVYSAWVHERVWGMPSSENSPITILRRLVRPVDIAESFAGQSWYLLVTSGTVFGLGTLVLVRSVVGARRSAVAIRAADAAIVLSSVTAMVLLSVVFMAGRTDRPDMVVYGRYNDAVAGIVIVVGLAAGHRMINDEWRACMRFLVPTGTLVVALTAYIELRHGSFLSDGTHLNPMIPGLTPLWSPNAVPVAAATIVSLTAVGVVVAVARLTGSKSTATKLAVGTVSVGLGLASYGTLSVGVNDRANAQPVVKIREFVPTGSVLGVRVIPDEQSLLLSPTRQLARVQLYEFYLPDFEIVEVRGDDTAGSYFFAPRFNDELVASGAEVVWVDPGAPMALWREP